MFLKIQAIVHVYKLFNYYLFIYMNTKITRTVVSFGAMVSLLASPVLAMPGNGNSDGSHGHALPKDAVKITDELYDLGDKVDVDGNTVHGYAFVHHAKGYNSHKPQHNGGGDVLASSCYAFISKGARWKNTESYVVDPTNNALLDEATIQSLIATGLDTWDTEVSFDVFGAQAATGTVDAASVGNISNNVNEVMFADIAQTNVIAVTYVWGIFWGKPFQKKLTEWDMVFDDTDFVWSAENLGVEGAMDFQNIAVHEIGHAAGMGHPGDSCTEESMYRFASAGEIKKRDLHSGDVAGIMALYK